MYLTGKKFIFLSIILLGLHYILPNLYFSAEQDIIENFVLSGLLTIPLYIFYFIFLLYFLKKGFFFYRCLRKK